MAVLSVKKPGVYLRIRNHVEKHNLIFSNFEKVCQTAEEGDFIVLEWPTACTYWGTDQVKAFIERYALKPVKFHGCMLGITARKSGKPI